MNFKLPLIAAFAALLALSACGGGGGGSSAPTVYDAAKLEKVDTVVGTGAEAAANSVVTVNYTLWLYDTTKAGNKGTQVDSGTGLKTVLANGLIQGWIQGIPGMKVGGKRTLTVPASLAYGSSGFGKIPANSGLVFDVELTAVGPTVFDAPALVKTDTVVGTGADAALGKNITVNYTVWLYDTTKTANKGTQVDSGVGFKTLLQSGGLIEGWVQGVPGMKVGGKRTLTVPSSLGYGPNGVANIPGNSGLVFDIELTAVN